MTKKHAFPNAYLEVDVPAKRDPFATAASVMFLVFGAVSAVADVLILFYILSYGAAPVLPLIGSVLDEGTPIGVAGGWNAIVTLGFGLVAVSVLEAVAGIWLWRSKKKGGRLGAVLQPLNFMFAYGFGIPILYFLAPTWLLLVWLAWGSLS